MSDHTSQIHLLIKDADALMARISLEMLDAIPMPVFCKTEDGRYVGGNDLFIQFIGRPREEVIGHTAFDIFDTEKAKVYEAADQALWETGGTQIYEGLVEKAMDRRRLFASIKRS